MFGEKFANFSELHNVNLMYILKQMNLKVVFAADRLLIYCFFYCFQNKIVTGLSPPKENSAWSLLKIHKVWNSLSLKP